MFYYIENVKTGKNVPGSLTQNVFQAHDNMFILREARLMRGNKDFPFLIIANVVNPFVTTAVSTETEIPTNIQDEMVKPATS